MGWCSMPPSEDAQLLLRIVERHIRSLNFGLDEHFPAEDCFEFLYNCL